MSSRVNLTLLVNHINGLPEAMHGQQFLDSELKFKIVYGGLNCSAAKIIEHVPSSFFSLEMSTAHLLSINNIIPLHEKVDVIFKRKLGIFADILCAAKVKVHETLLHHILPFLWGGKVSKGVLQEIVASVGVLLGEPRMVAMKKKMEKLEGTVKSLTDDNAGVKEYFKEMKAIVDGLRLRQQEEGGGKGQLTL